MIKFSCTREFILSGSKIASSIGGPLSIDQIDLNTVSIPSIQLNNFSGEFHYTKSIAKNVEIEMKLSAKTEFKGNIELPISDIDVDGSLTFPPFVEKHSLGDITMNAGEFSMLSKTSTMGPMKMTPDPIGSKINQIKVDQVRANSIEMKCTEMPLNNPLGLYLGSWAPIQNPTGPMDVIIEETKMDNLKSSNISSPKVTMRNISAENIIIPLISTAPLEIGTDTNLKITTKKNMDGVIKTGDANRVNWMDGTLILTIEYVIMRIKGGIEFHDVSGFVHSLILLYQRGLI